MKLENLYREALDDIAPDPAFVAELARKMSAEQKRLDLAKGASFSVKRVNKWHVRALGGLVAAALAITVIPRLMDDSPRLDSDAVGTSTNSAMDAGADADNDEWETHAAQQAGTDDPDDRQNAYAVTSDGQAQAAPESTAAADGVPAGE